MPSQNEIERLHKVQMLGALQDVYAHCLKQTAGSVPAWKVLIEIHNLSIELWPYPGARPMPMPEEQR